MLRNTEFDKDKEIKEMKTPKAPKAVKTPKEPKAKAVKMPKDGTDTEPTTATALPVSLPAKTKPPKLDMGDVQNAVIDVFRLDVKAEDLVIDETLIVRDHTDADVVAMADQITANGLKNPIWVTKNYDMNGREDGTYTPFAGLKRTRAAKKLGMAAVPVLVHTMSGDVTLNRAALLSLAGVENGHRTNPSVVELANHAALLKANGLSGKHIALSLNQSQSAVVRMLNYAKWAEVVAGLEGAVVNGVIPFTGLDPVFTLPDVQAQSVLDKLVARADAGQSTTKEKITKMVEKLAAKLEAEGGTGKKSKAGRKKKAARSQVSVPDLIATLEGGANLVVTGAKAAQFENVFTALSEYVKGKLDQEALYAQLADAFNVKLKWEEPEQEAA